MRCVIVRSPAAHHHYHCYHRYHHHRYYHRYHHRHCRHYHYCRHYYRHYAGPECRSLRVKVSSPDILIPQLYYLQVTTCGWMDGWMLLHGSQPGSVMTGP